MSKVIISVDLTQVTTNDLIEELLERSEINDFNVIDELAFRYFLKKLKPEKIKKAMENIK
ncbi:hypothetical protein [Fusobacterium necrophorum]|uniref:hypothetical protein n=1 Tax=Fusobacterium necrophorum TaxID=859 RepID=UPI00370E07A2